jgi:stearoyl-CoA desaturase (delta-9 desaturase)
MTASPDLRPETPDDDLLTGQSYAAGRADLAGTPIPDDEFAPTIGSKILIAIFIGVPTLALLVGIPLLFSGWISWPAAIVALVFWAITGVGITVGFHRHFTHGSFKATRATRIMLAVAGSMAVEGSVSQWVADHRKHHAFSDEVGDPHSPWRFGTSHRAVAKGLWFAHMGWLFSTEQSPVERYAPDVAADKDLQRVTRLFPLLVAATFILPGVIVGLITWSWVGVAMGIFWGGFVRVTLVQHVTWSINSVCHVWGKRPFKTRDRSTNVWWLAPFAFGENWHNLHHAEPTAARHGVLRGQVDISAGTIRLMEKAGWVYDVRWPKPQRIANKLVDPTMRSRVKGLAKAEAAASGSGR